MVSLFRALVKFCSMNQLRNAKMDPYQMIPPLKNVYSFNISPPIIALIIYSTCSNAVSCNFLFLGVVFLGTNSSALVFKFVVAWSSTPISKSLTSCKGPSMKLPLRSFIFSPRKVPSLPAILSTNLPILHYALSFTSSFSITT